MTFKEAVEYINAAPTKEERRRRKTEVFRLIYDGGDGARFSW